MLAKAFKKHGAAVVVETHGEVLFAPSTDLSRWKNRFSSTLTAAVTKEAPSHNFGKRNFRPHPSPDGKTLKKSIRSKTRTRITNGGGYFYIATGSSMPYAIYVDQGTGVFGGGGAYEAKVLPPYNTGEGTLYEAGWNKKPIYIKGQIGKHFFDKGLASAFRAMRMRSTDVPGEGISAMASGLKSFPENLFGAGNTPNDDAFKGRLRNWRKWRDEAYKRHFAATFRKGNADLIARAEAREKKASARRAYDASVAVAEQRKIEQMRDLLNTEQRKEEGRRKRAADEKRRQEHAAKQARAKSVAAAEKTALSRVRALRANHFEAKLQRERIGSETVGWRVTYTDKAGVVHTERYK